MTTDLLPYPSPTRPRFQGPYDVLYVFFGTGFALGFVCILIYGFSTPGPHWKYVGVGLVVAIAATGVGSLFGFLFGIPKYVSSGAARFATYGDSDGSDHNDARGPGPGPGPDARTAAAPAPGATAPAAIRDRPIKTFSPSTNLAEVSDWLTKLLLGAGLVQLTQLGGPLGSLVETVATGLVESTDGSVPGSATVVAACILAVYTVLGFLGLYLITTLWYGKRLESS